MDISIIEENEFEECFKMIEKTCRISFADYYPISEIEKIISSLNVENLKSRAKVSHFYVVKNLQNKIVGCGAITGYWGSLTESILLSIFVDPDEQRQGIGRLIIQTLENDEYGKRADRIEIPASMVALPFYKKCGYNHKNGVLTYDDGHFALEKFVK